jgi:hypothetical protein
MANYVVDGNVSQAGYEQLTVSSTPKALTAGVYDTASCAVIRVSGDIRYILDSTSVTISASNGMPWNATDGDLVIPMDDLSKFRMIRVDGSNVTADCLYLYR